MRACRWPWRDFRRAISYNCNHYSSGGSPMGNQWPRAATAEARAFRSLPPVGADQHRQHRDRRRLCDTLRAFDSGVARDRGARPRAGPVGSEVAERTAMDKVAVSRAVSSLLRSRRIGARLRERRSAPLGLEAFSQRRERVLARRAVCAPLRARAARGSFRRPNARTSIGCSSRLHRRARGARPDPRGLDRVDFAAHDAGRICRHSISYNRAPFPDPGG